MMNGLRQIWSGNARETAYECSFTFGRQSRTTRSFMTFEGDRIPHQFEIDRLRRFAVGAHLPDADWDGGLPARAAVWAS